MSADTGPRVRGNDWSVIDPPEPDSYTPHRSVSVVIPAYRAHETLPYTLAALEAQTYPDHLLEVVVVDDDEGPMLELPEIRPANTRVVRAHSGWGPANARDAGAAVADGDVLHWLDADMVPSHDHVARQMRWHHAIDHAVVLGQKLFLDTEQMPSVAKVHEAVLEHRLGDLFAGRWADEHEWVEKIWRDTDDLKRAGFRAFHVHVGATASVGSALYADAGGMDTTLRLSEDVELGYRLAMKGAVFVADRQATSWHLGRSTLMQQRQRVQRYNAPFIAQRVPDFRKFRQGHDRNYRVPYVEVVVDAAGASWEHVKYTVDGVLAARPSDLRCLLLGRWSELDDERRHPLDDPLLEARLVREEYDADNRVEFVDQLERTAFPAQFRLHLPVGWRPGEASLDKVTRAMQQRDLGLLSALLADGQIARLERTAAFERAFRVKAQDEDLDDVVDAVSGSWWSAGHETGFEHYMPAPTASPQPVPEPGAGATEVYGPRQRGTVQRSLRLARLLARFRRS